MAIRKLYLRTCSYCGLGMSRGYVMGSGDTYVCDRNEACYQNYLIESAIFFADNESFLKAEDKIDWLGEVHDQLFVGWTQEEYLGELYTSEGNKVDEEDINFGTDTLVFSEEEKTYPYDYMLYCKTAHKKDLVW